MSSETSKPSRGRPKTLKKEDVLNIAMMSYWAKGPLRVSINDICREAGVSKPGLYREFGGIDGLMKESLIFYENVVLRKLREILSAEEDFSTTLSALVQAVTTPYENFPLGCLYVKFKQTYPWVGEETQAQIRQTRDNSVAVYEDWIQQAQDQGIVSKERSAKFLAMYVDAQVGLAQSLIAQGMKPVEVREILDTALSREKGAFF